MQKEKRAHFYIGQLVQHKLFGYRGVVFNVDAEFSGDEHWYEEVAQSRPPKDKPWYHVLPSGQQHTTYVAERNLEADGVDSPIEHPLIATFFDDFVDGEYVIREKVN